jgi:galactose-1-phosphate uridylyltransferase
VLQSNAQHLIDARTFSQAPDLSRVGGDALPDYYHWHMSVIPRLTTLAGFEFGTGFYINSVSPEDAARYLREV